MLRDTRHWLVIGSFMCTYNSPVMNSAKSRMTDFAGRYARAVEHLRFTLKMFEAQLAECRYILFEHPAEAPSLALLFVDASFGDLMCSAWDLMCCDLV